MNDDELREMVAEVVVAAVRVEVAAASIAESAHNLMDLINRTQSDAAKMIAGQLKRSEMVHKKLDELRASGATQVGGGKIRLANGEVVELPVERPDAENNAR